MTARSRLRTWTGAVLLLATLPWAGPLIAQTVGDPVASRSAEALEHYEQGRYEEALRAYRDALIERPGSARLHLNVGDALYELGQFDAAADEFEHVTAADDERLAAQGYHNLGNSRYELQDYAAAAEAYRQALSRVPDDIDTKQNLELALQMLQPPPPQQGGNQQQEDQQGDEEQQQEQQKQEGDGQEQDEQQQDEQQQDQQQDQEGSSEDREQSPPDEDQSSPDAADRSAADEPQEEPRQPSDGEISDEMDEQEAEQLLDALSDREEEGQKRRFRVARRRDQEHDW